MFGKVLSIAVATAAGFLVLVGTAKVSGNHTQLISTADARVGRPMTPMSYAGVARRTARRGAYAAGTAAAAGAAYYGYYNSGCGQRVDAYGRVYRHC
jgi:hypothetical protein